MLSLSALVISALSACSTPAARSDVPRTDNRSMAAHMCAPTPSCPPPAVAPVCPAVTACPVVIAPTIVPPAVSTQPPLVAEAPRGSLVATNFSALPDWADDNPSDALGAFIQGCATLNTQVAWQDVCAAAPLAIKNANSARQFFESRFTPYRVVNADNSETGLVTGYYEPLLRGSRKKTAQYPYPIYAVPQDLLTIDMADLYPDLKFKRLRGRIVSSEAGSKVVPYFDRAEIESERQPLRGLEIVYVDDAVELFFLQIQGSGQVQLEDGSKVRVGYADQNGHAFRSLGGALIRRGEIKAERASMQGIKEWARRNPKKLPEFMNLNPSYIFFKELPNADSGPIGTLGVPLTAERSIAVDQRVVPLGVPVFLATTYPSTKQSLNRLMVAQDTGGAINGGVRADFYWGFGDAAGAQAGKMKQQGKMWVLLPRGYDPLTATATPTRSQ
jgi:membrane-bound lytic murein transglycosylase A